MKIRKIESFKDALGHLDGGKILDVACGEGQFIKILQNSLRSWDHFTGLDVNDEILKVAAEKYQGAGFHFVHGSSQMIPFEDNHFDLVSLSKGLHHLEDTEIALQEMKRVLKSGGYMVISEMYTDGLTESQMSQKLYHDLRVELDKILGVTHNFTFERKEILAMVEELHLENMQVYDYQEDQSEPMDPARIKEHSDKMDRWMIPVEDPHQYDYFHRKIQELKERFGRDGFNRPPQLVMIGEKFKN